MSVSILLARAIALAASIGLGLGALATPLCGRQQPDAARAEAAGAAVRPVVFDGVAVVDVETGRVRPGQRIVIVGRRIAAVGNAREVPVPEGAKLIAAPGRYVIPGLWDMHVHNMASPAEYKSDAAFLVNGVTGVREMLSSLPYDSVRERRRDVLADRLVSPRMVVPGYLKGSGRLTAKEAAFGIIGVGTPDEGRQVVDSFKAAGVDFIKVHDESMPRDVFFAVAAEARRQGLPVAGHLPVATVTMAEASDSGLRSIEHIPMWITSPCWRTDAAGDSACAALAARFIRNGTWLTPTMFNALGTGRDSVIGRRRHARDWYARFTPDSANPAGKETPEGLLWFLERLHRFGFPMLAGTDIYLPDLQNLGLNAAQILTGQSEARSPADLVATPGWRSPLHVELALLVEGGFSPLEALQTATINPAKYFDAADSMGTVAPGKVADLVLLDANPLDDIDNAAKVRAVVADGRYFDRAALEAVKLEAKRRIIGWYRVRRAEAERAQKAAGRRP